MANANRERTQQVKAIELRDANGEPFVIEDRDLVDLYFETDVTVEKVIHLQKRVNDSILQKRALNDAEARAKSREEQILGICVTLGLTAEEQLESALEQLTAGDRAWMLSASLREFVLNSSILTLIPEELKALQRFMAGVRPSSSTGIHDGLTMGYGQLDQHGFWQYPLPQVFVNAYDRAIKYIQNADTLELRLRVVLGWLKNDAAMKDPKLTGYAQRVKEVEGTLATVERNKP